MKKNTDPYLAGGVAATPPAKLIWIFEMESDLGPGASKTSEIGRALILGIFRKFFILAKTSYNAVLL